MHHRPSGPPRFARLGRLAFAAVVTTTVVGLVLAIPVISGGGGGSPAVELNSSSTSSAPLPGNSPVVMGLDGRPVDPSRAPEAPAGASAAPGEDTPPAATSSTADVESTSEAAPAGSSSPSGTPAPGSTPADPPSSPASPGTTTGPAPGTTSPAPPAAPAAPAAPVTDPASEVLALVDAERAELGCDALLTDTDLAAAAQAHSATMSAAGVLGLDGLVGAVAQGPDAASVVAAWLADPALGAALLDCSHTSAGVAVVDGWWTTLLA